MSMSDELGIMMEPIVAWRTWSIMHPHYLASMNRQAIWPIRERMEAECLASGNIFTASIEVVHSVPTHECTCGIYALKKPTGSEVACATFYGEVYLWGKVIEYKSGYRAQYAYPKQFFAERNCRYGGHNVDTIEKQFSLVAGAYGVPLTWVDKVDKPEPQRANRPLPPPPVETVLLMLQDNVIPAADREKLIWHAITRVKAGMRSRQYHFDVAQKRLSKWQSTLAELTTMMPDSAKIAPARAKAPQPCQCGCGEMTKGGRFRPGHDSKFHSAQNKERK